MRARRRILDAGMARYKNQTFVAMGIAVLGLIVAMICNLCLLVPIVAFLAAVIFYLVAVVCEVIFVNMAFYSVSGDDFEENDVVQFRHRVRRIAEICFGLVIALFAGCLPLLNAISGSLWELYWELGWFLSGAVCAVLALLIYLIILYFVNAALSRKGIYRRSQKEEKSYSTNRRLKFLIGIVLACVLVITALIHSGIWNMDKSVFVAGTTFTDYDSFVEFMEQESTVEGTASDTQGNVGQVVDDEGNVLCEYICRNNSVTQISYGDSADRLPITVYTSDDMTEASSIWRIPAYGMFFVYLIEISIAIGLYRKKAERCIV